MHRLFTPSGLSTPQIFPDARQSGVTGGINLKGSQSCAPSYIRGSGLVARRDAYKSRCNVARLGRYTDRRRDAKQSVGGSAQLGI
jgi:hypothetical protein